MSVQKPREITRVIAPMNGRGVVMYDYCAIHSNGNVAVVRKCLRNMLEANVVGRETCCGQYAQSAT